MADLIGLIAGLVLDTGVSWLRMFTALFLSVIFSLAIGIYAARRRTAERVILPVLDVLQTLPILAFFPLAIAVFVFILPGFIGINAAVIFLIFTSMTWNIAFAVYEAIKALPNEFIELARLYDMGPVDQLRKIFIPAAMPRVVEQSVLSWSIGLFYLVTSEIFSTGSSNYSVTYGIGVALTRLAASGNFFDYGIGIAIFIAFVIATRFLFFSPLEKYSTRYSESGAQAKQRALTRSRLFKALSEEGVKFRAALGGISITRGAAPSQSAKKRAHHFIAAQAETVRRHGARYIPKPLIAAIAIVLALLLLYYFSVLSPGIVTDEYLTIISLGATFARVWLSFAIITAVAVPVCVYLVFKTHHAHAYLLTFQIFASIPATILLPVIVASLNGLPQHSEFVAFVVFFLSGIWYIIFSVIASSRTLPQTIFEVKKVFGVSGMRAWKDIYLKALVPGIITGSVTAIAAEWNASIVAEYFTTSGISSGGPTTAVLSSVHTGIGLLLDNSLNSGNFTMMILALINLTAMILIINTFVWKRFYRNLAKIYG